ncbi:MAG: hypothetical protein IKH46_13940 [Lachnospiraceae bacterium]|nr:hypothetical protein [Lachnospiraceae bacterium]
MVSNICQNCGGLMEWTGDRRKMRCPFCMTEFLVEERETDAFDKANVIDPLLFRSEWDINKLREKRNGKDFITEFMIGVNEVCTAEKEKEILFKILSKSDNGDMATETIRPELFRTATQRAASVLEPGETPLVYQNSGIFSKGKEGSVITDRRTITFDTKEVKFELHKDIRSLQLDNSGDIPSIRVNEQFAVRFSMIGTGYKGTGAAAALICLYAFAQDPDLKQIRLV